MSRRIEVAAYDPKWPALYEAEAARLSGVFGADLVSIHHIGSTAVPGLSAKPIIDILVVVRDICTIAGFNPGMVALGYRPRGECLDAFGTPGRFYFSQDIGGVRTHQVHVMQSGHFDIRQKLVLRDYLRACPEEVDAYGRLKMRLAGQNTRGIVEYIEGKDAFVQGLIGRAEAWAGPTAGELPIANDLLFLVSLIDDLSRCGINAWVFGGWAEELRGLRLAGPHGDVDLLYPAADFERIDALLRSHPSMIEIHQKRFSHKRAAEYQGVRVEFFLLEPDGHRYVTRFFDGRYIHTWPENTLAPDRLAVGDVRLRVAGETALRGYRDVHARVMAAASEK